MGDYCLHFQQAARTEPDRRQYPIAEPNIHDTLNVRMRGGVKAFVCEDRQIIACLASGDRLELRWNPNQHGLWKSLGLKAPKTTAEFCNDGDQRDCLRLDNGRIVTVQQLSRRMTATVLRLAPRDHVHEPEPAYDEAAMRRILDGVPLPTVTTRTETRCGVLVGV